MNINNELQKINLFHTFTAMKMTLEEIAKIIDGEIEGERGTVIRGIGKIETAKEGDLTFLANPVYTKYLYTTKASAVIVNKDFRPEKDVKVALVRVDDSYRAISKILQYFHKEPEKTGIDSWAFVHPTAKIAGDVYIGPFVYVGENVEIGKGTKIYPHTYIGDNVKIGKDNLIYANVSIYHDTRIGNNVTIHSGTVIGSDGFGFAPNNGKSFKKVPQIGNVIIEDNVEIGSNTSIDRATMGSTIIRRGVKLDNFIQVAHNVEIGENTVIASKTGISGSVKIGKNCMIGGQVGIAGHLKIGDNVKVGAQSGITKNVKDGEILIGTPAIPAQNFRKSAILFKNLQDLYEEIKRLKAEIAQLKSLKNE